MIVLGQFILFQGARRGVLFYVVFWLVPIVCMYPMILRLKTITEHFDPGLREPNSVHWIARRATPDCSKTTSWEHEWNTTSSTMSSRPSPIRG